jgi:hypothetical protein
MPIFGLGLHILIAIYFAIHAVRRGQNLFWLIVLFSFPLLGSIVYFFVVYLPELRGSRTAMVAKRVVAQALDPGRELREASLAYEHTPTVNNQLRLAAALLQTGDALTALMHYRAAAQGPFAGDSLVVRGLARCQLVVGQPQEAVASLEKLFADDAKTRRHPEAALLYARAQAAANATAELVRAAFAVALEVATDAEPKCRYADWLMMQAGDNAQQQARGFYQQIIKDSALWHSHAKIHNAEWLRRARAALNT